MESFLFNLKKNIQVSRVILHGSYARGDVHEGSDIDLIIIGDFLDKFHKRIIRVLELTDLPIEPLCYTPEEFLKMQKQHNSFICTAIEEGIELI
jgi:hypothetical protein